MVWEIKKISLSLKEFVMSLLYHLFQKPNFDFNIDLLIFRMKAFSETTNGFQFFEYSIH